MEQETKNTILRNVILFLDAFVAFSIIAFSKTIIQTPLGKAGIFFGFAMLTITLIFRLMHKW
jgi:uncharacterized membrane protein (DUF485 family)